MLSLSDLAEHEETPRLLGAPGISFLADATEHRAQFDVEVLELVHKIIATAHEGGEPTLLGLLQTHEAITAQLLPDCSCIGVNERAYSTLIEISLSPEAGGWWGKLEAFLSTAGTLSGDDDNYGDDKKTDDVSARVSVMMLTAMHKWLFRSFPQRQYALPFELAGSQSGRDLALWCKSYPALGRVEMRSIQTYFSLQAKATQARSRRVLQLAFKSWLFEAATMQASRDKSMRFRMRTLLRQWRKNCVDQITTESINWKIAYSAFVQWSYQSRYDRQMRACFKEWYKHTRFSRMRMIVFEERVSRAFLHSKNRAFIKLSGYASSMHRKANYHVQRKYFTSWKTLYLLARSKAVHANIWIRFSHQVLLRRVFNIWLLSILQTKHLLSAMTSIAESAYLRAIRRAFCLMALKPDLSWQINTYSTHEFRNDDTEGVIAFLLCRHDRALKEIAFDF